MCVHWSFVPELRGHRRRCRHQHHRSLCQTKLIIQAFRFSVDCAFFFMCSCLGYWKPHINIRIGRKIQTATRYNTTARSNAGIAFAHMNFCTEDDEWYFARRKNQQPKNKKKKKRKDSKWKRITFEMVWTGFKCVLFAWFVASVLVLLSLINVSSGQLAWSPIQIDSESEYKLHLTEKQQ